ncbi:prophage tail fiber N-terminal domain-containing protein, partial [Escherichia coli]|uniref:prophage tail fiber N-terminal domain-containing protein n=1 Tax=Escherichia coli TaxID=562 RepID=UPI0030F47AD5
MAVKISGVLKDGTGKPVQNCTIQLKAKRNSTTVNRPGFPGECFICELRLPDHCFRWKHNKLFLL